MDDEEQTPIDDRSTDTQAMILEMLREFETRLNEQDQVAYTAEQQKIRATLSLLDMALQMGLPFRTALDIVGKQDIALPDGWEGLSLALVDTLAMQAAEQQAAPEDEEPIEGVDDDEGAEPTEEQPDAPASPPEAQPQQQPEQPGPQQQPVPGEQPSQG
jgi:hypothetical protein